MSAGPEQENGFKRGPWHSPHPRVEAVLFVAVQAVMFVCIALVAAQALAAV